MPLNPIRERRLPGRLSLRHFPLFPPFAPSRHPPLPLPFLIKTIRRSRRGSSKQKDPLLFISNYVRFLKPRGSRNTILPPTTLFFFPLPLTSARAPTPSTYFPFTLLFSLRHLLCSFGRRGSCFPLPACRFASLN